MSFEEIKEILHNYPVMVNKIINIKNEIAEAKQAVDALLNGVKEVEITGMLNGGTLSDNTYNRVQLRADVFEERIKKLLDDLEDIQDRRDEVADLIRHLTPDEEAVITERYIKGIKWNYIPIKVHMSRAKCFYVHDLAISKMLSKIKN